MRSLALTLVGGGFRLGRATGAVLPAALFLAGCQSPNSLPIEAWEPTTVRGNSSHLGQQTQAARQTKACDTTTQGGPGQHSLPKCSHGEVQYICHPRARSPGPCIHPELPTNLPSVPSVASWNEYCVDKKPLVNPGQQQLCPDIPCHLQAWA